MSNYFGKTDKVILEDYKSEYRFFYETEKQFLNKLFKEEIISINHIGSTAVPGIKGKPVIDIGVEVANFPADGCEIEKLKSEGYIYWDTNPDIHHQFFFKGLPRTHHLHIYPQYNEKLRKQILFRDFLILNPGEARKYEELKINLAIKFYDDREEYTRSKTTFINSILQKIKT